MLTEPSGNPGERTFLPNICHHRRVKEFAVLWRTSLLELVELWSPKMDPTAATQEVLLENEETKRQWRFKVNEILPPPCIHLPEEGEHLKMTANLKESFLLQTQELIQTSLEPLRRLQTYQNATKRFVKDKEGSIPGCGSLSWDRAYWMAPSPGQAEMYSTDHECACRCGRSCF